MARTLTISLGNELQSYAQQLVDSGAYSSVSEVVRDALRNLREHKASSSLEQLKALIDEGDNSGEPVDLEVEQFLSRMKKR
ncbi:type II toxin-antitoxin system ParD family antitoxin [Endozoicomonas numazuensis]|uniref:type II toxin-antitoxin system ParD family antitoxin n=1 Tax=Endozoicomonas numazuensis TaxID=1137799 RepID=UPI0005569508|nr:type II toxin-antitoxin system ParD family antitoxin [Endozoicomonas numazuensis]